MIYIIKLTCYYGWDGAGTTYANLGGTHISQEDISIARSIPNMQIIAPSDPLELKEAVRYCCKIQNHQFI